jgi:amino acid transporter
MISIIGMLAMINGALIQMIMASRVLYGMSSRRLLPPIFSRVNKRTQTPLVATVLATAIVLILSVYGSLATLAEATSVIILIVFSLVNLSLLRVKRKDPKPDGLIVFPVIVPALGFLVSISFVVAELISLFSA